MPTKIANEEQAFDLLRDSSDEHGDVVMGFLIDRTRYRSRNYPEYMFSGWPRFEMRIEGEHYNSSIPTSIMEPMLDMQKVIHNLYCQMVYGHREVDRLTEEERNHLEIVFKIKEGSTNLSADLTSVFKHILQQGIDRMTSTQATVTLIVFALLITGSYAWKQYLNQQAEIEKARLQLRMSAQEAKRMRILERALKQQPDLQLIRSSIDDIREHFLRCLKPHDELFINDELLGSREKVKDRLKESGIDDFGLE